MPVTPMTDFMKFYMSIIALCLFSLFVSFLSRQYRCGRHTAEIGMMLVPFYLASQNFILKWSLINEGPTYLRVEYKTAWWLCEIYVQPSI
jgi:hypothetical protein